MKSKEELKALKQECGNLCEKFDKLTEEDLEQITGGNNEAELPKPLFKIGQYFVRYGPKGQEEWKGVIDKIEYDYEYNEYKYWFINEIHPKIHYFLPLESYSNKFLKIIN